MLSHEKLGSILQALPDPAFVLTRSGRYAAVFGGRDSRFYHDGGVLVGRSMHEVLGPGKADWFARQIGFALASRAMHVVEYELAACDVHILDASGPPAPIWFEARIQPLDFRLDGEDAVLWVASNITDRKASEARLLELSEEDALSGLANRRKLMSVLATHFATFNRYGMPVAVLLLDVDGFKQINDGFGHQRGDEAIIAIAQACRATIRGSDLAARLGGDEFVVVMPNTPMVAAGLPAERLRARIAAALAALGLGPGRFTVSAGLGEFVAGDRTPEDVLRRADKALYVAKRSGRNTLRLQGADTMASNA
jgi:diguanylate cyclase (GGDEF)-like protein